MSCISIRQRLLASERPDRPAADAARHVAGCPDCRAWLRRLVRLEQRLSLVPVPPSVPPPALLAMLRSAPADALVKTPALLRAVRPRAEGGRQKLALAFSLAAALVVFAIGWSIWPHIQPPNRPTEVVFSLPKHEAYIIAALKAAQTPPQRVTALTDLADKFFTEAQKNPDDHNQVKVKARHFRRLVQHDLIPHARDVSPGDRPMLKDIASRLGQIEGTAANLAKQWEHTYPDAAREMQKIATDAREAEQRLRQMAPV
jgi:hypothetical protein